MPSLFDDIRLSNSMTVEHNTLGPGVIGHILRNRTISKSTYAATDRWFAYDQVGSVTATMNSSGGLVAKLWQDAFGNPQSDWSNGQWLTNQSRWGHNTKEYDGIADLVYMYQRWYQPETGRFVSQAPYEPMVEHPYRFTAARPTQWFDPSGAIVEFATNADPEVKKAVQCSPYYDFMNRSSHVYNFYTTGRKFVTNNIKGESWISIPSEPDPMNTVSGDREPVPNPSNPLHIFIAHESLHAILYDLFGDFDDEMLVRILENLHRLNEGLPPRYVGDGHFGAVEDHYTLPGHGPPPPDLIY